MSRPAGLALGLRAAPKGCEQRPYRNPLFDIAVPAVASPTGPRLAGMHGIGLLSIGASTAAGFDALALHWDVIEAASQRYAAEAAARAHCASPGAPPTRRLSPRWRQPALACIAIID